MALTQKRPEFGVFLHRKTSALIMIWVAGIRAQSGNKVAVLHFCGKKGYATAP